MKTVSLSSNNEAVVLTKAICNLAKNYALSGKDLHNITGFSESSITRMRQGQKLISPDSKEGEIALLLIRVYRSLNAMVGNNHEKAIAWLRSKNRNFAKTPLEELQKLPGLISVLNYLDAMRGKI
ncbi:antitoxin Xre/MbcA/ParS toxin-binding domain-containing protein [Legionella dresdenensis]|uniref:Antitoxin Xre/MbcA/ParS toxin-binding domain-containing protein n=1 Tax=Legionella dresdenensis TaxID=450200 RepID=A0ABV8CBA8_9GAMM